jgi:SulP family sulfate permease
MIALLSAYKSHLLTIKNIKQNIIAGLIVGVIALPLSMAFAIASGVHPASGIYTAIVAGLIVGIFGGTQVQISGPTGAFVIILANISSQHGFTGLACATFLAGILLILMSLFKLGSIIKYMPYPVIVGFTTGIGLLIFVSQWPAFLGLPIDLPTNAHFFHKIKMIFGSLTKLDLTTTFFAYLSLLVYFLSQKCTPWIPAPLTSLLITTVALFFSGNSSVATIGSVFGSIPQKLPIFFIPDISSVNWFALATPACTIALLCAIESLLSATVADAITNTKHNSNQELFGQGLANIITPFFGGFASTGAIARTATNIRSGGNCPVAAITHSLLLILIVYFCAPLAAHIPLCALATILLIIAYNMSDLDQFMQIAYHAPWYDVIVLLFTCFLTIMVDLVFAVTFGALLSILFFTLRMYQTSELQQKPFIFATLWKESITHVSKTCENNIIHFKIKGPFFFGAADKLEQAFAITDNDPACIIFNFAQVPFIDMTGLTIFHKIVQQFYRRGVKIYIESANDRIMKKIKKMNIDQFIQNS